MAEEYFPFDAGAGADSTEARWRRMARLWAPNGVVGVPGSASYNLTISGLTATLTRGASGFAEAWVDGFMHRLITADFSVTVPANTDASNSRIDRLVLRLNQTANTIAVTRLQGTPAAVPSAPALTQADNGTWDIPLWSFTVPPASAAPLNSPVDERVWIDPTGGSFGRGIVAFGSSASSSSTAGRVLGGLNVVANLTPGRIYEAEWSMNASIGSGASLTASLRAIAGATAPATGTGTAVGSSTASGTLVAGIVVTAKFTVGTSGPYAISPFTSSTATISAPSGGMTLVVRDAGSATGIPGTTPTVVP